MGIHSLHISINNSEIFTMMKYFCQFRELPFLRLLKYQEILYSWLLICIQRENLVCLLIYFIRERVYWWGNPTNQREGAKKESRGKEGGVEEQGELGSMWSLFDTGKWPSIWGILSPSNWKCPWPPWHKFKLFLLGAEHERERKERVRRGKTTSNRAPANHCNGLLEESPSVFFCH